MSRWRAKSFAKSSALSSGKESSVDFLDVLGLEEEDFRVGSGGRED